LIKPEEILDLGMETKLAMEVICSKIQ